MQLKKWTAGLFRYFTKAGQATSEALFPPTCPGCGVRVAENGTICPSCWGKLRFITKPYCPVMGIPFQYDPGDKLLSGEALRDPPAFKHARAVVEHDGLAQRLVTRLKYGDHTELAPWMANWMLRTGRELVEECDIVIPIPLHRTRFWKRGYNQSAELARVIAAKGGKVFFPEAVIRIKATHQQVGLKMTERRENVRGAFSITKKAQKRIKNSKILLIDDVYTTGATVRAASETLIKVGAASVDVLTFSHAMRHDF